MKRLALIFIAIAAGAVIAGSVTEKKPFVVTKVKTVERRVPVTNGWIIVYNDDMEETNRVPVIHFETRRIPEFIAVTNWIPVVIEKETK